MRIFSITGSLRESSYNQALARAFAALAPAGVEIARFDGLREIPPYDQDLDQPDTQFPDAVARLREEIEAADALLVVTPEYNGSVPGVLKNAIDWASSFHRGSAFRNKTVAIAAASTGGFGGIWALQDLRRILGIAGARVIEGEVAVPRAQTLVDDDGVLDDAMVQRRVAELLERLVAEARSAEPAAAVA